MILCLDSGNSRLKWALHDGQHWSGHAALTQNRRAELPALLASLPPIKRACIANVAGESVANAIRSALAPRRIPVDFVASSPAAAGVCNGYEQPERLGIDRWCALIGARSLHPHSCLVVGVGTAMTIDTLNADGLFRGGLIMPGFGLMRRALARGTAQLPMAGGHWQTHPRNTADAIFSGCLEAMLGAVERAFARIAHEDQARCLLFGGAAPLLASHLSIPFHLGEEQLVLQGLLTLAKTQPG